MTVKSDCREAFRILDDREVQWVLTKRVIIVLSRTIMAFEGPRRARGE